VKFDTAGHSIPTKANGCTNIGNNFWTTVIETMVIYQAFMSNFIN